MGKEDYTAVWIYLLEIEGDWVDASLSFLHMSVYRRRVHVTRGSSSNFGLGDVCMQEYMMGKYTSYGKAAAASGPSAYSFCDRL